MKWHKDDFWISDETVDVDKAAVFRLLATTYWAAERPKARTEQAVDHSLCFSLKIKDRQIGFARVLTDGGSYSIVVDVVIETGFQRQGLGRWLLSVICSYPSFADTVLVLWTTDQVDFYNACGLTHEEKFQVMRRAPTWMKTNWPGRQ